MVKSCIYFKNEINEIEQDLINLEIFIVELE